MGNEKSNYETYKELMEKYKFKIGRLSEINMDDYDVVVSCNNVGYAHVKYTVLKNAPNLIEKLLFFVMVVIYVLAIEWKETLFVFIQIKALRKVKV